jgi:predicted enzyme related to lactoylglutathione lyase
MIIGAHCLFYAPEADAAAVQAWLRDVARLPAEESMPSWPLYGVGGAELAVHPSEGEAHTEVYLLCDDIEATVADLQGRGAELSRPLADEGWGVVAWFRLPGGGELPIYEARHKTAIRLAPGD